MTGQVASDDTPILTRRGAIVRWLLIAIGALIFVIGTLGLATEGLLAGAPGIVIGGAAFLVGIAARRFALERFFPIVLAGLIVGVLGTTWDNKVLSGYGIPWKTVMEWSNVLSLSCLASLGLLALGLGLHDWKANKPTATLSRRGGLWVAAGLAGIAALYGVVIAVVVDQRAWASTAFFALVLLFNLAFAWDVARSRRLGRFTGYVLLANILLLAMGANQGLVIGPNSELGKDWWMQASGVVLTGMKAVGLLAVAVIVLWDPTKPVRDVDAPQSDT